MPNQLSISTVLQPTSLAMLTTDSDIFTPGGVRQSTPQSATIITTPPVFSGISSAVPTADGPIQVSWGAFTSINQPVYFQVYIAPGSVSAATLFALPPVVIVPQGSTSVLVSTLSDLTTYLIKGQVYTLGVRCIDSVKNQNTNLVTLTATAIGTTNLASVFQSISTELDATADSLSTIESDLADDAASIDNSATRLMDMILPGEAEGEIEDDEIEGYLEED